MRRTLSVLALGTFVLGASWISTAQAAVVGGALPASNRPVVTTADYPAAVTSAAVTTVRYPRYGYARSYYRPYYRPNTVYRPYARPYSAYRPYYGYGPYGYRPYGYASPYVAGRVIYGGPRLYPNYRVW